MALAVNVQEYVFSSDITYDKQPMGLCCWPVYATVQHCLGSAEDVCASNILYSWKILQGLMFAIFMI